MNRSVEGIFAFSTENYEPMKKFFSDIGFSVTENGANQIAQLFEKNRSAFIQRGTLSFLIEESYCAGVKAPFNLWVVDDYTADEIDRIIERGYRPDYSYSHFGEFFNIVTPDGGRVLLNLSDSNSLAPGFSDRVKKYSGGK